MSVLRFPLVCAGIFALFYLLSGCAGDGAGRGSLSDFEELEEPLPATLDAPHGGVLIKVNSGEDVSVIGEIVRRAQDDMLELYLYGPGAREPAYSSLSSLKMTATLPGGQQERIEFKAVPAAGAPDAEAFWKYSAVDGWIGDQDSFAAIIEEIPVDGTRHSFIPFRYPQGNTAPGELRAGSG
jgi:hypothetical protein